jgi:DNA-binding SARP family transcriptional activator
METFWPDADPSDTRRNLHQAIYSLRQSLRQEQPDLQPILYKQDTYLLNPEMVIWLDFEEFENHANRGRRLEAAGQVAPAMEEYSIAVSLYQGGLLDEDLYEDWVASPRERLRQLYLDVANRLSDHYLRQKEYSASITLSQNILTYDNCNEEAYRCLMKSYFAQGQRHLAVRQYLTCVQTLHDELALEPSEDTVAVYWSIVAG